MSEPDVSELLTVEQAIRIIDAAEMRPRVIRCALEQAQGLRLAQDLVADRDYPPFDKSLMDGFATRGGERAGTKLRVVGEVAAGKSFDRELKAGQAVAIMTGAPLPAGAEAVVPVEETETAGEEVVIKQSAEAGRYVAARGSDTRARQVLLRKRTKMEAAQLAVAAMVGAAQLDVYSTPKVGILSTGDEIVPFHETPGPTQIRNSNSIMLSSLVRRMGARVIDLGHVADEPDVIREALLKGMQLDVLLVTGGMSMGKYDYVPKLLNELGVDLKITKLRIKPGKPFVFGVAERRKLAERRGVIASLPIAAPAEGRCFVFGLPGNPVSGFACTVRLVSRLITRMSGGEPQERWAAGSLLEPIGANGPREFYQPAVVEHARDGTRVRALSWKGSADLFTLAEANAMLVRAENEPALGAGAVVRVIEL